MYESENKCLSGIKKHPQGQSCNVSRGIKNFRVSQVGSFLETQVHRWISSVWVQKNLNLFQHECYLKLLLPPLPHLLSEQNDGWIRPTAPRRGRASFTALQRIARAMHRRGQAYNRFGSLLLFDTAPWRLTHQLEREHSVEPLNHPSQSVNLYPGEGLA